MASRRQTFRVGLAGWAAACVGALTPRACASQSGGMAATSSWAWWTLLAAVVALAAVIVVLRTVGYRRLSVLWQCLVASVLAHVALTAGMSLIALSQPVFAFLAHSERGEATVSLVAGTEADLRAEIRHQLTELPVADPSLSALLRADLQTIQTPAVRSVEMPAPASRLQHPTAVAQPLAVAEQPPAVEQRVAPRLVPNLPAPPAPPAMQPRPVAAAEPPPAPAVRAPAHALRQPARTTAATWHEMELPTPAASVPAEPIVSPAPPDLAAAPVAVAAPIEALPLVVPPAIEPARAAPPAPAADLPPVAVEIAAAMQTDPRPVGRLDIRGRPASPASTSQVPPADPLGASLRSHLVAEVRRPLVAQAAGEAVQLGLPLDGLGELAPRRLEVAEPLDHRAPRMRGQLVRAMGGSPESESAVAAALAFLARSQEPDGRWTWLDSPEPESSAGRGANRDDVGLTGLAVLCFLAADCTPGDGTPHSPHVQRALAWLLALQKPDGDLRGDEGDMYGQGIATLALGEAAAMTREAKYGTAAVRGARFIVRAQNRLTGGWRYAPQENGDTSVLGWQVMALHSVERLGVPIPQEVRTGALRWLSAVSRSRHGMLVGYQSTNPTPTMTAEALFARLLLKDSLAPAQRAEAVAFLRPPGDEEPPNFYYCYYGSLALMQLQDEAWPRWNAQVRDHLTALQIRGGSLDGSWDAASSRWGAERGGRVYATALATLTLEVYYRYLPMYARARAGEPRPGAPRLLGRASPAVD